MRAKEWVKEHPIAAVVCTAMGTLGLAVKIAKWPGGIVTLGHGLEWLATDPLGNVFLVLGSAGLILWYWVLFPWLVSQTKRSQIAKLCLRLDVLAADCHADGTNNFLLIATAAGSVVRRLLDKGAFAVHVLDEERIGVALRHQLSVQAQCQNPRDHAAQPEYQAFWITRECCAARLAMTGHVEVTAANIKSGCEIIAADVRRQWQITVPLRPSTPSTSTASQR
jgi:hypothetical protein